VGLSCGAFCRAFLWGFHTDTDTPGKKLWCTSHELSQEKAYVYQRWLISGTQELSPVYQRSFLLCKALVYQRQRFLCTRDEEKAPLVHRRKLLWYTGQRSCAPEPSLTTPCRRVLFRI